MVLSVPILKHFRVAVTDTQLTLTLKCQTKIVANDILIFYFYLSKKIRLDFSCDISSLIFSKKQ